MLLWSLYQKIDWFNIHNKKLFDTNSVDKAKGFVWSCAKDEEIVTKNVFICCAILANNKYNLQIKTKIAKWPQSPIKKNAFKVKKEYYRWPLTAKILLTCLPSVSFTEWYFFYLTCVMMMLNHCCWRVAWSSATERQGCVDWSVESEAWFLSPRSVSLSHTHTQLVDTGVRYPSSNWTFSTETSDMSRDHYLLILLHQSKESILSKILHKFYYTYLSILKSCIKALHYFFFLTSIWH